MKIILTITEATTAREVSNAVRRAFHEASIALTPGTEGVEKGVRFKVKETKEKAESAYTPIRAWAVQNGFTLGKRGRVPAEVLTAYAAAH